jgi:hypothetical protein
LNESKIGEEKREKAPFQFLFGSLKLSFSWCLEAGAVEDASCRLEGLLIDIKQAPKPVQINRDTIKWYAGQIGFEIKNSSQYDEVEKLLKKRLSGGYWKIIATVEPLTEEAGNCQEKYCLVRGIDACEVCREKDIILKGGQPSRQSSGGDASLPAVSGNQGASESGQTEQSKGFLSTVADWIGGLLGMLTGRL